MSDEELMPDELEYVRARRELEEVVHESLTDKSWKYLVKHFFIDQYLQGEKKLYELANDYREIVSSFGEQATQRRPAPRMLSSQEEQPAIDRVKALSLLIAKEAEKDEGVRMFRSDVLRNSSLLLEHVEAWVFTTAESDGQPTWWLTDIPIPHSNIVYDPIARGTIRGLEESKLEIKLPTTPFSESIHFRFLAYGVPHSPELREIPTNVGGVLERLRRLSVSLSRVYGWTEAEATLFVLTNEAPEINLLTYVLQPNNRFPALSRIVLTVDLALSPREVAEKYSPIRQKVLKGRHREQGEKHLQLAIFMAAHPEPTPWVAKMAEWNRTQPAKWKYDAEENFARDCRHAQLRLLGSK